MTASAGPMTQAECHGWAGYRLAAWPFVCLPNSHLVLAFGSAIICPSLGLSLGLSSAWPIVPGPSLSQIQAHWPIVPGPGTLEALPSASTPCRRGPLLTNGLALRSCGRLCGARRETASFIDNSIEAGIHLGEMERACVATDLRGTTQACWV
jgi:hypothetical protein